MTMVTISGVGDLDVAELRLSAWSQQLKVPEFPDIPKILGSYKNTCKSNGQLLTEYFKKMHVTGNPGVGDKNLYTNTMADGNIYRRRPTPGHVTMPVMRGGGAAL